MDVLTQKYDVALPVSEFYKYWRNTVTHPSLTGRKRRSRWSTDVAAKKSSHSDIEGSTDQDVIVCCGLSQLSSELPKSTDGDCQSLAQLFASVSDRNVGTSRLWTPNYVSVAVWTQLLSVYGSGFLKYILMRFDVFARKRAYFVQIAGKSFSDKIGAARFTASRNEPKKRRRKKRKMQKTTGSTKEKSNRTIDLSSGNSNDTIHLSDAIPRSQNCSQDSEGTSTAIKKRRRRKAQRNMATKNRIPTPVCLPKTCSSVIIRDVPLSAILATNDLRERWPTAHAISKIALESGSSDLTSVLKGAIFGEKFARFLSDNLPAKSATVLTSGLRRLLHSRRRLCLSAFLNHWAPLPAGFINDQPHVLSDIVGHWCLPPSVVSKCLGRLFNHIVNSELVGEWNKRRLTSLVADALVGIRKNEAIRVRGIVGALRPSKCPWAVFDSATNYKLFAAVANWLVCLLLSVTRGCFYITDVQWQKTRLVWYRKPAWLQIAKLGYADLRTLCKLQGVDSYSLRELKGKFGVMKSLGVRFIPKENGLRPIVTNAGGGAYKKNPVTELNQRLRQTGVRAVLESLLRSAGVTRDLGNVRNLWKKLWRDNPSLKNEESTETLLLVKTDLYRCFDNIDQKRLLGLLEVALDTSKNRSFTVYSYHVIENKGGKIYRRRCLRADASDRLESEADLPVGRGKIVVYNYDECDVPWTISAGEVLHHLRRVISHHVVNAATAGVRRRRQRPMRQTCGIAQGFCVSSLLCDLYLTATVARRWPLLVRSASASSSSRSLLLRYADDFLLSTVDRHMASEFLRTSSIDDGDGMVAMPIKTASNFELSHPLLQSNDAAFSIVKEWMPWCGMQFSVTTGQVRPDYDRWQSPLLRDTFYDSVRCRDELKEKVKRHVLMTVRSRLRPIFFDAALNSKETVEELKGNVLRFARRLTVEALALLRKRRQCSLTGEKVLGQDIERKIVNMINNLVNGKYTN